tara:strand:- start:45 stop:254 length:210 start_codon:yes stop_codon:yes gene_type:complete
MKANLKIELDDLKALFTQSTSTNTNMTFADWSEECVKSYMIYFNNGIIIKSLPKYTYSEWVNAQIIALY